MNDSTVLVAVDFSSATDAVLAATQVVTKSRAAQIVLLHVVDPDSSFVSYRVGPQHERDWRAEDISKERTQLEELARNLSADNANVRSKIVEGPTAETILAEADRIDADLIVVGSHGHGAIFHLVAGSVTMALLHRSKIPVLVVPVADDYAKRADV